LTNVVTPRQRVSWSEQGTDASPLFACSRRSRNWIWLYGVPFDSSGAGGVLVVVVVVVTVTVAPEVA